MPIEPTRNSGAIGVLFLVTADAVQAGDAFAFRPANDICEMRVTIVALLRVVRGSVAVDAAW
jgi:hypothetical protein